MLKTFFSAFAFVFSLFVAIAFVLILFEELDAFLSNNASFGLGLTYVILRVPHELVKATPMIVVLAMVSAIGTLIRHNEILMLYIAGYTPVRLAVPLIAALFFLVASLFFFNEYLGGPLAARATTIMEMRIKGNQVGLSGSSGVWLYGEGNRIFRAQTLFPKNNRIDGLSVFVYQGDNRNLSEWIDADTAIWNPDSHQWLLSDVNAHTILDDGSFQIERFETIPYNMDRTPEDFGAVTQNVEQMSHGDLKKLVDKIREAGENPWMYLPDLRIKEAFLFAVLFLGLLAYIMMMYFSSSGKASGIGLGLIAVIVYFMSLSLGRSFSQAGAIPPWLGAWTPNLLCLILSTYFFNRLRREI